MNRKPKTATHRAVTVMVRYTLEEYEAIVEAAKGEQIAVHVRRVSLAGGAEPDPDPRVVEVHARSKCGRFDLRVGVFTMTRALGMKTRHEAQGWAVTLSAVAEQPKVGGELPDPAAQINALTIDEIIAARLRDDAKPRTNTERKT